jgi:hypothetical protein
MCEENQVAVNMNLEAAPHKRYHVNATRSMYFSEEFETAEEAAVAALGLVQEGYATVAIRDTDLDKDMW